MQRLKPYIIFFLLSSSTALAEAPCNYKANDIITYQGKIDSVKLISENIENIPNVKYFRRCVVSIEAKVKDEWYPSKGVYIFGPNMSATDACSHAEVKAKKQIMRTTIPETITSKKNIKCDLTSSIRSCKVIYMNTSIGKVKFMESCEK